MDCCSSRFKRISDTRLSVIGVILGWVNISIDLVLCIYFVGILANIDESSRYLCKVMQLECGKDLDNVVISIRVIISINLFIHFLNLVGSILVIIAIAFVSIQTEMKSHVWLLPWLCTNVLVLAVNVFSCHMLFCIDDLKSQVMAVIVLIHLAFCCVMFVGIVSLYRKFIRLSRQKIVISRDGTLSVQML